MKRRKHRKLVELDEVAAPHALASWREIAKRIGGARHLAVMSDFDGSLAPIRRDPRQVRLSAGTRHTLLQLSRAGVLTGIISGRRLRDVRQRIGLPELWYAGSHGLALAGPGRKREYLATAAQRRRLGTLSARLKARLGKLGGVELERKDGSLAIHYRRATPRDRVRCHLALASELAGLGRERRAIELHGGKFVWEIMPRAPQSKWSAIQRILRRTRFAHGGMLIYIGDDIADERVFAQMRLDQRLLRQAIPVMVGEARPSTALFRLRTIREVSVFLRRVLEVVR